MASKTKPHGEIAINTWIQELEKLQSIQNKAETVTGPWALVREWAVRWGIPDRSASRMISRGIHAGLWESKKFKRGTIEGYAKSLTHYKPK